MDKGLLRNALEQRQNYWGWQSLDTVMSDGDWQALLERDLALGEMSEAARRIFRQYGAIEHCSGGFIDLVKGQLTQIGRLDPDYTFAVHHDDRTQTSPMGCGTCSAAHRDRFFRYIDAAADWLAGRTADDEAHAEVNGLLGDVTENKRETVRLLLDRIGADWHALDVVKRTQTDRALERLAERTWNPDGKQLWPAQPDAPVECRILWLLSCNWHAVEDLKIILKEIGTGGYPGGFVGHGHSQNYLEVLNPVFDQALAWMAGDTAASGEIGELLGETTAEKRWLVVAFAKLISASQEQGGYGRLKALDDMVSSLTGQNSGRGRGPEPG